MELKIILLIGISQAQKWLSQSFSGVWDSYIHTYMYIHTHKYMYVYERGPLRREGWLRAEGGACEGNRMYMSGKRDGNNLRD